ncbi:MAG: autoinducer binding domain-containing protein [Pseudomonadota bacterium]
MDELVELFHIQGCKGKGKLPCIDQIKSTFNDFCADRGYPYISFNVRPRVNSNDLEETTVYWATYAEEFISVYIRNGWAELDPIVRCVDPSSPLFMTLGSWAEARTLAVNQPMGESAWQKRKYVKDVEKIYAHAAKHNMRSGFFMAEEVGGQVASVSFATSRNTLPSEKTLKELRAAIFLVGCLVENTKACGECGRVNETGVQLTRKEQLCLRIVLDSPANSTIEQLAARSGRETSTFKRHLQNVRKKLGRKGERALSLAIYCEHRKLLPPLHVAPRKAPISKMIQHQ